MFSKDTSVLIVAGVGNNGGDGIVLARQLHGDYDVRLYLPFGVKSSMAEIQLKRARNLGVKEVDTLEDAEVIVDAILGARLNKPLNENIEYLIHQLNSFKGHKIACDIPTGVSQNGLMPIAFMADITLTMGARIEALYLDESKDAVGEIACVDLGISSMFYGGQSQTCILEESDLKLPSRTRQNSHKGSFGHAAVFSRGAQGSFPVWQQPVWSRAYDTCST